MQAMESGAKKCQTEGDLSDTLNADLWSEILSHLSLKEILSLAAVCKKFHEMALEHTAKVFNLVHREDFCVTFRDQDQKKLTKLRKRASTVLSLKRYLARRAQTLEVVVADVHDAINSDSILQAASCAQNLRILDVSCVGLRLQKKERRVHPLPSSLEVYRSTNFCLTSELEFDSEMSKLKAIEAQIPTGRWAEDSESISVLMKVRAFASPDVGFADIKWQLAILEEVQFLSLGLHQNETAPTDEFWEAFHALPKLKQPFLYGFDTIGGNFLSLSLHESLELLHIKAHECSTSAFSELLRIQQISTLEIDSLTDDGLLRIPSHSLRDSRLQFLEVFSFQKPVKLDLENLLSAPHLRSVLLNCLEGVHLPKADQPIHIASPLLYVDLDHDCALRFNAKVEAGLKSVGFDCRSRVLSIGDSNLFNPLADNGFFADRAITAAIETFEGAEDSPTLKSYIEVLEASHI